MVTNFTSASCSLAEVRFYADNGKDLLIGTDADVSALGWSGAGFFELDVVNTTVKVEEVQEKGENSLRWQGVPETFTDIHICPECGAKVNPIRELDWEGQEMEWTCSKCDWYGTEATTFQPTGYAEISMAYHAITGVDPKRMVRKASYKEIAKWEAILESHGLGLITESEIISELPDLSVVEEITASEKVVRKFESLMDSNPRFISKDKLSKAIESIHDEDLLRRLHVVDETRRYYWYLRGWDESMRTQPQGNMVEFLKSNLKNYNKFIRGTIPGICQVAAFWSDHRINTMENHSTGDWIANAGTIEYDKELSYFDKVSSYTYRGVRRIRPTWTLRYYVDGESITVIGVNGRTVVSATGTREEMRDLVKSLKYSSCTVVKKEEIAILL